MSDVSIVKGSMRVCSLECNKEHHIMLHFKMALSVNMACLPNGTSGKASVILAKVLAKETDQTGQNLLLQILLDPGSKLAKVTMLVSNISTAESVTILERIFETEAVPHVVSAASKYDVSYGSTIQAESITVLPIKDDLTEVSLGHQ